MATPVIQISGIGPQTAKVLSENGFKSAEAIAKAGQQKLQNVPGFGPSRAKATITAAKSLLAGGNTKSTVKAKPKKNTTNKKDKKPKKSKPKKAKKSDKDKKKKDKKKNKSKNKKNKKDKKKNK